MAGEVRLDTRPILDLCNYLTSIFIGREREVVAVLTGLASGEPVFLCGPPGTAKTALVEEMARCLNARYFYYLLTRFTEPDELLGPLNIAALREGKYERIMANRLPDSDVIFLDEIFKAGSAVLNTLLDIILYRRILNGTTYIQLPTLAVYTASNEVTTDADLAAFYDRLLVRCFVNPVPDALLDDLLQRGVLIDTGVPRERLSLSKDYILQLQKFVALRAQAIVADAAWRERIIKALLDLKEKGVVLSDRRKVKLVKVFAAVATVLNEKTPSLDSLAEALRLTAPHSPEDLGKVESVILENGLSSFDVAKYNAIIEEGKRVVEAVKKRAAEGTATLRDLSDLKQLRAELVKIYQQIPATVVTLSTRNTVYSAIAEIDRILREVMG
ncbi:MAG: AAA family ATPase [Thermofilaceae archaeon]